MLANNNIYIATASFGDCPLTRDNMVESTPTPGPSSTRTRPWPPVVWAADQRLPAADPADGSVYVTIGTLLTAGCTGGEPLSEAIVKFSSSLSLLSSWQIPADQQIGDSDFVATPTLFTATINGAARSLVGAANKNGIFYALDRTNLAAGAGMGAGDRQRQRLLSAVHRIGWVDIAGGLRRHHVVRRRWRDDHRVQELWR